MISTPVEHSRIDSRLRATSEESKRSNESSKSFFKDTFGKVYLAVRFVKLINNQSRKTSEVTSPFSLETRFIINTTFLEEYQFVIEELKTSESVYGTQISSTIMHLNDLNQKENNATLRLAFSTFGELNRISEKLVSYFKNNMKNELLDSKKTINSDPRQKFNEFMSATKSYLEKIDTFQSVMNIMAEKYPQNVDVTTTSAILMRPFSRAIEYRYAFRRIYRQLKMDTSNFKKYALDKENCFQVLKDLDILCKCFYEHFSIKDVFNFAVEFENNLELKAVKPFDNSKKPMSIILQLSRPCMMEPYCLPVSPSFVAQFTFSQVEESKFDKKENEIKNISKKDYKLHLFLFDDTLIICNKAAKVSKSDKKTLESLQYPPIPLQQVTSTRISEERIDLKIFDSLMLALVANNKEVVDDFKLQVDELIRKLATKLIPNDQKLPVTSMTSIQGSPSKSTLKNDMSTNHLEFGRNSLNKSLSNVFASVSPMTSTSLVEIRKNIEPIERSEIKLAAHQILLRESPTDDVIFGWEQEHNKDVKEQVKNALSIPMNERLSIENVIEKVRNPEPLILFEKRCKLWKKNPDESEYVNMDIQLFKLQRTPCLDIPGLFTSLIAVNNQLTGRSFLTELVHPNLNYEHNGKLMLRSSAQGQAGVIYQFKFTNSNEVLRFVEEEKCFCVKTRIARCDSQGQLVIEDEAINNELCSESILAVDSIVCGLSLGAAIISIVPGIKSTNAEVECQLPQVSIASKLSKDFIFMRSFMDGEKISICVDNVVTISISRGSDDFSIKLAFTPENLEKFVAAFENALLEASVIQTLIKKLADDRKAKEANEHDAEEKSQKNNSSKLINKQSDYVGRINPRDFFKAAELSVSSISTLAEDNVMAKFKRDSTMLLKSRRASAQSAISVNVKERTASYTEKVRRQLDVLHNQIRGGNISNDTMKMFEEYMEIPKNEIFDSAIESTVNLTKLTQIVGHLLMDSLKYREQLNRMKPTGKVSDAMKSLAAKQQTHLTGDL